MHLSPLSPTHINEKEALPIQERVSRCVLRGNTALWLRWVVCSRFQAAEIPDNLIYQQMIYETLIS
jgi:hypothetical protein